MSNRFKFEMRDGEDGYNDECSIVMTCQETTLDNILLRFSKFLRGCGYEVDSLQHVRNEEIVVFRHELEELQND